MKSLLFIILLAGQVCACSTSTKKKYLKENCNEENAYKVGLNDVLIGNPFVSEFFNDCPENAIQPSINAYKRGYIDAQKKINDIKGYNQFESSSSPLLEARTTYRCSGELLMKSYYGEDPNIGAALLKAEAHCFSERSKKECAMVNFTCDKL